MHPFVIHVGYPKSASTYIQRRLFKQLQSKGVINFSFASLFGLLDGKGCAKKDGFFSDDSSPRVLSQEKFSGNPFGSSEDQCYDIVKRLHRLAPDARILVVTREQYSYCDSVYRWAVADDTLCTFSPTRFFQRYRHLGDYLRFDVAVERWKSLFDRVAVVPYEMLTTSKDEFDRSICDALEVEVVFGNRPENIGLSREHARIFCLMNPAFKLIDFLSPRSLDRKTIRKLRNRYLTPQLPQWLRAGLDYDISPLIKKWDKVWIQSNRNLQKHVNWDVSHYGYKVGP